MSQPSAQAAAASEVAAYDPLEVLASTLTAPHEQPLDPDEIKGRIGELLNIARQRQHDACRTLIERLTPLSDAGAETLGTAARERYTRPAKLAEDVYALRGFAHDPETASRVAEMRRYLEEAVVPESEHELALDRAIAEGQVSFSLLLPDQKQAAESKRKTAAPRSAVAEGNVAYGVFVADPRRLATAEAAFNHFRSVYSRRYEEQHAAFWEDADRQRQRLEEANRAIEALTRLNSLAELGPPVGAAAIERYEKLTGETAGCGGTEGLREALKATPLCPECGIRLGDAGLAADVEDILTLTDRSIERQMSRLSSVAVQAVLARSNDPRVERFLKVVQATQITTLTEILDDDLVGYLRRFLLEARISTLLEPILDRVERGGDVTEAATGDSLQELAEVLHRALRGSGRTLPPGRDIPGDQRPEQD